MVGQFGRFPGNPTHSPKEIVPTNCSVHDLHCRRTDTGGAVWPADLGDRRVLVRTLGLTLLVLAIAGCQRTPEPAFIAGPELAELEPNLQKAVAAELLKYCGTACIPS